MNVRGWKDFFCLIKNEQKKDQQIELLQELLLLLPQRMVVVPTSRKRMCILDSISRPFRICRHTTVTNPGISQQYETQSCSQFLIFTKTNLFKPARSAQTWFLRRTRLAPAEEEINRYLPTAAPQTRFLRLVCRRYHVGHVGARHLQHGSVCNGLGCLQAHGAALGQQLLNHLQPNKTFMLAACNQP